MLRPVMSLRLFGTLAIALGAIISSGCSVKYRHEVETAGTEAKFAYGAGGFIRYDGYTDDKDNAVAGDLQIASIDFKKPGSEITVRFVGVIHIGDIEYYKAVQRDALDTADVVLFEGVKMAGQEDAPKEQTNALSELYSNMGRLLGVGFQKDGIDYTAENFVHCDVTVEPGDNPMDQQMNPAQMQQAMTMLGPIVTFKEMLTQGPAGVRTEDALKHNMAGMMLQQMDGMSDEELFEHYRKQDGTLPKAMRNRAERAAKTLRGAIPPGGLPGIGGGGMSEEMKKFVIDDRNDYVMNALKERLAKEDHSKAQTIAIFWGAGHGPGMAKALREWGYEAKTTTWFRAWAMNGRGKGWVAGTEDGSGLETEVLTPARPMTPSASPKKTGKKKVILY